MNLWEEVPCNFINVPETILEDFTIITSDSIAIKIDMCYRKYFAQSQSTKGIHKL